MNDFSGKTGFSSDDAFLNATAMKYRWTNANERNKKENKLTIEAANPLKGFSCVWDEEDPCFFMVKMIDEVM